MFRKLVAVSILSLCLAQTAAADTIIKFDLGNTGPDLQYSGGVFSTIDDGMAASLGDQNTGIDYVGFLDPLLADILAGASFTLEGVNSVGAASVVGPLVSQQTDGGTFSIWNEANELLLSAELGEGVLSAATGVSVGSFFNTEVVNFTGGSLLSYIAATPGGISIALANILTGNVTGVLVGQNNNLLDFTADADGLITGEPADIPEPSTMILFGSAAIGGLLRRRRRAE
jgi:hypothetical protein